MENEPIQMQQPQVKGKGAHSWVWVVLLIVALVAGGTTWWWQYSKTQDVQKQLTAEQQAVTNAQKNIANLQAEVTTLKADPTITAKDTDLILAATDAYVRAPVAVASEKFTYDIKDNTGKFAKVSVGVSTGGGYSVTLKKVDNNWTVLFAGQDLPGKDVGEKYGLPEAYYQK